MFRRFIVSLVAIGAVLVMPAVALGSTPAIYHTIGSKFAGAQFSTMLDDCRAAAVWISSSDAKYAPQPGEGGGVNKQGLTAVSVVVQDTCQPPVGKGYPVLFDGFVMTFDPLQSTARLESAWLNLDLVLADSVSGADVPVSVSITWLATGPAHPDTVPNNHSHFPFAGNVNTHDNTFMRPAVAFGSVTVDGVNLAPNPDENAVLQSVKSACMEIGFPHYDGETLWCFGF
jgi:hypothetical protein